MYIYANSVDDHQPPRKRWSRRWDIDKYPKASLQQWPPDTSTDMFLSDRLPFLGEKKTEKKGSPKGILGQQKSQCECGELDLTGWCLQEYWRSKQKIAFYLYACKWNLKSINSCLFKTHPRYCVGSHGHIADLWLKCSTIFIEGKVQALWMSVGIHLIFANHTHNKKNTKMINPEHPGRS